MLGFGKKKKKDKEEKSSKDLPEEKKRDQKVADDPDDSKESSKAKKKKKKKIFSKKLFSKKLIFIIFLVLIAVGASGFLVYNIYFTTNDPFDETAKYKKIELEHINLPEEMIVFTFTYFRKVYLSMIDFNKEINLLDEEIQRIEAVAKNYPELWKNLL